MGKFLLKMLKLNPIPPLFAAVLFILFFFYDRGLLSDHHLAILYKAVLYLSIVAMFLYAWLIRKRRKSRGQSEFKS
jgi:hypothetical protein